ncbi:MAG: hypothetical protein WCL25_05145, partial [bacterium]
MPVALELKEGISKQTLLEDYGFAGITENITLQDVVNLIVGKANTRNQPSTLRYIAGTELQFGVLYDFFTQANRDSHVPNNAIYSGANAIHCPSYKEYTEREVSLWSGRLKDTGTIAYIPEGENSLPTEQAAANGVRGNELVRESLSDISFGHRTPDEIIAALKIRKNELARQVSGSERELLEKRFDYLRTAILEAYADGNQSKYTFYHALVAISNFLVEVVQQIAGRDNRLNVYLARDGINFWLAGYMLAKAKKEGKEGEFIKSNVILHLSRSLLGTHVYNIMKVIIEEVDAETKQSDVNYWQVFMRHFEHYMNEDSEFRAAAEVVYQRLPGELRNAGSIRIVESLAEGILTGFLKAVLIFYENKEANNVEEFIAATKWELNPKREVVPFKINEQGLEARIGRWFIREGLAAPERIVVAPFKEVGETMDVDDRRIERRALEAQIFQMFYPFSEINLGHPIELHNGVTVKSEAAKQLGFYLRQLLVINSIVDGTTNTRPSGNLNSEYAVSQEVLEPYRLSGKEKELLDFLVHKHNEALFTVSDTEQVEFLKRLSAWIALLSRISGTGFGKVAEEIIAAEKRDAVYSWQFERLLFEIRQFSTFSGFYNTMVWSITSEGVGAFYTENFTIIGQPTRYALSDIVNKLREVREIIGKVKRNITQHKRMKVMYADEETKTTKAAQAALLTQKDGFLDLVEKFISSSPVSDNATGQQFKIEIKKIMESMDRLYVAQPEIVTGFIDMVMKWAKGGNISILLDLYGELSLARQEYRNGQLDIERLSDRELTIARKLHDVVLDKIKYKEEIYLLSDVIVEGIANCVAFAQIFYILGKALGFNESLLEVYRIVDRG